MVERFFPTKRSSGDENHRRGNLSLLSGPISSYLSSSDAFLLNLILSLLCLTHCSSLQRQNLSALPISSQCSECFYNHSCRLHLSPEKNRIQSSVSLSGTFTPSSSDLSVRFCIEEFQILLRESILPLMYSIESRLNM
jgi:hypothetical protein